MSEQVGDPAGFAEQLLTHQRQLVLLRVMPNRKRCLVRRTIVREGEGKQGGGGTMIDCYADTLVRGVHAADQVICLQRPREIFTKVRLHISRPLLPTNTTIVVADEHNTAVTVMTCRRRAMSE